ncbi:precorrin-2 C(20)-methyltransferase [Bengtsoniella intestinalis]|uniref:precorrin-2 C(20)-methyltransferase n=1 Tax=Bengtsoniella intestinalis TaxID=3073143 RepID=UPI00391F1C80
MMDKGILYGIGVGPGDPELLTTKAVRLLQEADIIAVPDKGSGEKTALNIVKDYIVGKELLYCSTPMTRDAQLLDAGYTAAAEELCALLEQGKTVAFITLGDPTVYSTYIYIHKKVVTKGYQAQIIPGVTSFCAVAARLGRSLCEGSERLMIVPASHKEVDDCLQVDANFVFMKAGREIGALKEKLSAYDLLDGAAMVENCSMETERVYEDFAKLEQPSGYFSVVLVKGGQTQ